MTTHPLPAAAVTNNDSRPADRARPITVMVAALTCGRPDMLERLLKELGTLRTPDRAEVSVLIVDNDRSESGRPVVARYRELLPGLNYAVEPVPGIPAARNHALRVANAAGTDLLAFIDDDEYPDRDWLVELVRCWRQSDADLVGGPVAVAPCRADAPLWSRWVNRSLAARMARKNRRTGRKARSGGRFTIVTNNWLCDLAWQRRTGLMFDERLQMTGGSDTQFYHAGRRLGMRARWCPEAVVNEAMDVERLTLRYQFHRASMQSIQNFRRNYPSLSARAVAEVLFLAPLRCLSGCLLMVVPVLGAASPTIGARSIGWAVGRVRALFGARSTLYARGAGADGRA